MLENVNGVCWVVVSGNGSSICDWTHNPERVLEVPVMAAMFDR